MTLKYTLETLDGLDEGVQGLYKETDGGFVLDVAGVVPQSKFEEVNQKALDNATEAQRRRRAQERVLEKLGVENADGLDDAIDVLLSKKPGKPDADHEAVIAQIKQASEAQIAELQGKLAQTQLSGVKADLVKDLVSAGYSPKVADMIAGANASRLQLDETGKTRIMQPNGNPLAGSGSDGFATTADLANELAAAMPELLTDTGKGGGGKPPASSGGSAAPNGKFGDLGSIPGFSDLPVS